MNWVCSGSIDQPGKFSLRKVMTDRKGLFGHEGSPADGVDVCPVDHRANERKLLGYECDVAKRAKRSIRS